MERVWLGLGSNLGDSRYILQGAWAELGKSSAVTLLALSSPYASDPVGMASENRFLNAAGIVETELDPYALLSLLQTIEKGFGREKKTGAAGYQDRLLDLDMLYFGDRLISEKDLQIPHPYIFDRLFVLAPLVEIDPSHCDSRNGKSVEQMHGELLQKINSGVIPVQHIQRETWKVEH